MDLSFQNSWLNPQNFSYNFHQTFRTRFNHPSTFILFKNFDIPTHPFIAFNLNTGNSKLKTLLLPNSKDGNNCSCLDMICSVSQMISNFIKVVYSLIKMTTLRLKLYHSFFLIAFDNF